MTIILFIEVARRSFTVLSRPEIYVLYYMAGASLVSGSGLLWNQFLVQSESFRQFGIADKHPAMGRAHRPGCAGPAQLLPSGVDGADRPDGASAWSCSAWTTSAWAT